MKVLLNPNNLPAAVRRDIQSFIDENNVPAEIQHLTEEEAFDYYLKWNGIIGWTDAILGAIKGIKHAAIKQ